MDAQAKNLDLTPSKAWRTLGVSDCMGRELHGTDYERI